MSDIDIRAAQDALARSDDGNPAQPGDAELIYAYERYCQQEHDRFMDACRKAERAEWLAGQCPTCEDGGTGGWCDDHDPEGCGCESTPDGYDTDGCVQHDLTVCGPLVGH